MQRRSVLSCLLALLLVLMMAMPATASGLVDVAGKLVILHTNDIHGYAVSDISGGTFGYAAVAKLKKDLTAAGASVLLLDAGDATQGTPLVNISYGQTALEFMNAAGYDAMTLGNHEFDWGSDNLQQILEVVKFKVLSANIVNKISGETFVEPNTIFTMDNGLKVGVFGLSTPETLTKTHPDKVNTLSMFMGDELVACAQAQVDLLKGEACDLIVCLSHLGIADESAGNRSTDVLEKVTGIDLMIDAHSHSIIEGEVVNGTTLVSTGEYFHNIGMVVYDGESLTTTLIKSDLDADVTEIVNAKNAEVQELLSQSFATTEVLLNGERDPGVRTEETNLGDFACDAILWAAKKALGEDKVVAAINNGGGIRASIQAGEITMNDMKTVFPYGNQVTVLTITGAELLEVLEAATFSTPDAIGAFPQVSGIVFTLDTTVPYEQGEQYPDSTYFAPAKPGSRVSIETVGGEPFDIEALYNIATNDFSAAGGDTYYALRYANQTSGYMTGVALEDALVNYVTEELGGVVTAQAYGEPQGRIKIIK